MQALHLMNSPSLHRKVTGDDGRCAKLADGKKTPAEYHREVGKIMWEYCGMSRNEEGLKTAIEKLQKLKEE